MMAPRKLKYGKDFKMVQRAKICNEEELAHALGDAISSSIPEVVNHPKMNARVAPETLDDQVSCGSLESSLDSSTRSDPEECRRALRKKPRRRSRESRLASNSPRRKSRKVYPSSSSSELFSSDQEELPRKRRDRRRSSNSGRSGVKLQRLSSRQQSRDRRRSRSNKVSHTRKRSPPPRFPDRSNLSRQSQVSTPTEIMAHEDVQAGGSKQTNRHEQSNKQDHASIVDTRFSSQNRIPQSPNTSQNRTHHEHNSAPGTSGTSKQKQSGRAGAGGGRAGSGDGQAGSGGGRAGAGDGRAGSGDGRAGAGGGRAGTEGGVNIVESQLSVHVPVVPEDEGTTRTQMQILKEKVAVLQRTIQKLEKATDADLLSKISHLFHVSESVNLC